MAQGIVTVNNLNLAQGAFPEVERKALFIGIGSENTGALIALNSQSDLDQVLGEAESDLKTQVAAAEINGGENWQAYAMVSQPGDDWRERLDEALQSITPELVVVCTPIAASSELDDAQAKAESVRTSAARRVIILMATVGIDADTQSWSDYIAAQVALVDSVAAYRVAAIPQLHGNNLGVLAGRLCNRSTSIADSPMRVATGPLLSLGDTPVDSEGLPLSAATLAALDAERLSVPQTYPDYPGTYWGDCNLLDVPAGDYQVIEYLRIVDKAARAVRLLAIARVANRQLNNTTISTAANKTYFMRPLHDMSRGVTFNGNFFPAEIRPPSDDDITIHWPTSNHVEIYLALTPYNSPKQITANIALDLSSGT